MREFGTDAFLNVHAGIVAVIALIAAVYLRCVCGSYEAWLDQIRSYCGQAIDVGCLMWGYICPYISRLQAIKPICSLLMVWLNMRLSRYRMTFAQY